MTTGILLLWTEHRMSGATHFKPPNKTKALAVGLGQAIATIPGISRSGTTICIARLLGWQPQEAAYFSFLLVIPTILAATFLKFPTLLDEYLSGGLHIPMMCYAIGLITSWLVGWASLRGLLFLIQKTGLRPFGYYCLILGALTTYFYNRGIIYG